MVISINDASEIPIYQQIRNQIVLGISDGRLAPGEQLPTVRALAEEIGINSMTVSKAYTLLKQEGYIYTDRRSGARVRHAVLFRLSDFCGISSFPELAQPVRKTHGNRRLRLRHRTVHVYLCRNSRSCL